MGIYEYALAREKKAEDFYRQLSEKTSNKGLKTIFGILADEELRKNRVKNKISPLVPVKQ